MRKLSVAFGVVALMAMLWPSASAANDLDRKTILTFSGPVGLPGLSLPPGTYTFQLVGSTTGNSVTEVRDKDGTHLIKTFLTIPSEPVEPANHPAVTLARRAPGAPEAITAWFYPGERTGYEFVYPREQTPMSARTEAIVTTQVADSTPPAVARAGSTHTAQPATAAQRQPAVQAPSQPVADPNASPSGPDQTSARGELPKTASWLPWMALVSGLSFAGGLGVRRFRLVR